MKYAVVFFSFVIIFVSVINASAISTSAQAAVLLDAQSGQVLYSQNAYSRLPMASTTKIMTALILCEKAKLDDTVTVTKEAAYTEGSSMGLKEGIAVTYRDLLYGMMLSSGNDAANMAAIGISGSIEKFVEIMNLRAQQLGLTDTHFNTPSGLDGESHYTTAYDLAKLTRTALKNEDFADAAKTKSITLNYGGTAHTLVNHNRLLNFYSGAIGVKTGYTMKSGRCLVSAATRDGNTLIAVTLNDRNDWNDHKALLDYGFDLVVSDICSFDGEEFLVDIKNGIKETTLLQSQKVVFSCAPNADFTKKVYLPEFVDAPVLKGQKAGYIEYYNGDRLVATQDIFFNEDIEKIKKPKFVKRLLNNFLELLGE